MNIVKQIFGGIQITIWASCIGFASEAAHALIEYLFTHEKLGRTIATTGYKNLPSQKVMQKLGMTIQHLEEPQSPDQFVVGVLANNIL